MEIIIKINNNLPLVICKETGVLITTPIDAQICREGAAETLRLTPFNSQEHSDAKEVLLGSVAYNLASQIIK